MTSQQFINNLLNQQVSAQTPHTGRQCTATQRLSCQANNSTDSHSCKTHKLICTDKIHPNYMRSGGSVRAWWKWSLTGGLEYQLTPNCYTTTCSFWDLKHHEEAAAN